MLEQIHQFQIEKLREQTEKCRAVNYSPLAALVIGQGIEIEASWFRAITLAFDSIPPERWREA